MLRKRPIQMTTKNHKCFYLLHSFLCLVTHLALSRRPLMMYNFFGYFTKPFTDDGRSPSQCLQHQHLFIGFIPSFYFHLLISYIFFLIVFFPFLYYICQPIVSLSRMCLYALASIVVYAISYLFVLHSRCHFFILLL